MCETLYDLLARSAEEVPTQTAVDFQGDRLDYAGLLEGADSTASLLRQCGAAPGRRVAFSFRKSIDALIALFGVIRTGAAYVPLDPAWPAERVGAICRDAGIELWVGDRSPAIPGLRTAVVADPAAGAGESTPRTLPLESARDHPPASEPPRPPADGVANILYTSGSTGRPKGVQITTRSLLHFARWAHETFDLQPDDRVANHAPYHFDLSTLDIFAAVRAGATMCPVPETTKMLPYQTARFIAEQRITVWYSVPSALVLMQPKLADHDLSRLRHVIFAGEVMPKPALRSLAAELPRAAFTNLYGPTETNVCTWHRVTRDDLHTETPLPIGRPIHGTRAWVRDEDGRPVDGPATGELLIAGPTVTTGYVGDPELSARRLVPAPDGDGDAFRTGDRVTRRDDGLLLFHGRIDRMIKWRGHRVEPGEIEAALCRHPGVREAAVVPVEDSEPGPRIKACLVPGWEPPPHRTELLAHCRDHLPAYMLPEVWQFFDRLPRTDRGKIDLQALQDPADHSPDR